MKNKKLKLGMLLGLLFMLLVGALPAFAANVQSMQMGKGYTVKPGSSKDRTRYFSFTLKTPAKVRISGNIHSETFVDFGGLEVYLDPKDDSIFSGTRVVDYFMGMTNIPYTEIVLNKGKHTLRVTSEYVSEYSICVGLRESYKEGPATAITLQKNATISTGMKYTLKPALVHSYEKLTGMKWTTSNKKIATVDSKGVITAKKKGTCKINCQLKNGKTYTCKVTVKDNVWTGRAYSKIKVGNYDYGQVWLEPTKISYSGNKLKVECAALNNRMFKAKYFKWIEISVKTDDGKVIAKKKFGKKTLNIKPYGKKKLTFTFPSSAVKMKNYDLRTDTGIYISYDYYYYWQY